MRITIFSIGTQGDVRPFVALGKGLQRAGHQVCIASGETCEDLVSRHGLAFSPLSADFLELMATDPSLLKKGLNPLSLFKSARESLSDMAADWADQGLAAAMGADLLLGNGMVAVLAASLGEALDIPMVETHLQPVTPCRDIPPMMLKPPRRPVPGGVNLALYHSLRVLTWQMLSPAHNSVRKKLKLNSYPWYGPYYRRPREHRLLYGYSETLLPRSLDWRESVQVSGNWFLDEGDDWKPPKDLAEFLAAGDKPIYIGFGSMLSDNAEEFTSRVVDAVRRSGQRAILATGWGGLAEQLANDDNILVIQSAPHDWLFPRVSLAVHHGGVGTTAAALRAGIPSVVVPFFGDQPFWAWRLAELGVAPQALDRDRLSAPALASAIAEGLAPECRIRASVLGEKLRGEDGVARAIAQLRAWQLLPEQGVGDEPLLDDGELLRLAV